MSNSDSLAQLGQAVAVMFGAMAEALHEKGVLSYAEARASLVAALGDPAQQHVVLTRAILEGGITYLNWLENGPPNTPPPKLRLVRGD